MHAHILAGRRAGAGLAVAETPQHGVESEPLADEAADQSRPPPIVQGLDGPAAQAAREGVVEQGLLVDVGEDLAHGLVDGLVVEAERGQAAADASRAASANAGLEPGRGAGDAAVVEGAIGLQSLDRRLDRVRLAAASAQPGTKLGFGQLAAAKQHQHRDEDVEGGPTCRSG
jgi:hypothetical protein